jgi:NADH-quinone oxidoreductase subunit J
MPQIIVQIVFFVIAALIIGAAIMVVTAKDIIHAALWLISSFCGVGALYLLLEAEFLAIVQLLVYVGAISVLVLFAIMLTRHLGVEGERRLYKHWWLGLVVSISLFGAVLLPTLLTYEWRPAQENTSTAAEMNQIDPMGATDEQAGQGDNAQTTENSTDGDNDPATEPVVAGVEAIGTAFMREYLIPFEIASIVLLVALIGAIVIAFEERSTRRPVLTLAEEVFLRKKQQQEEEAAQ